MVPGAAIPRGVMPEASAAREGASHDSGGLVVQEDYAYLRREWSDDVTSDPAALQFIDYEIGSTVAPFGLKRVRSCPGLP